MRTPSSAPVQILVREFCVFYVCLGKKSIVFFFSPATVTSSLCTGLTFCDVRQRGRGHGLCDLRHCTRTPVPLIHCPFVGNQRVGLQRLIQVPSACSWKFPRDMFQHSYLPFSSGSVPAPLPSQSQLRKFLSLSLRQALHLSLPCRPPPQSPRPKAANRSQSRRKVHPQPSL